MARQRAKIRCRICGFLKVDEKTSEKKYAVWRTWRFREIVNWFLKLSFQVFIDRFHARVDVQFFVNVLHVFAYRAQTRMGGIGDFLVQ